MTLFLPDEGKKPQLALCCVLVPAVGIPVSLPAGALACNALWLEE